MRAFVALTLDTSGRDALVRQAMQLAALPWGEKIRWVKPESLHLTLRFLGESDAPTIARMRESLEAVGSRYAAFSWRLGRVEAFPSASRPRVIAVRVEEPAEIERLAGSVERAAVRCGLEPERRRFRAHVTLGRARRDGPRKLELGDSFDVPLQRASELVLYQSELGAAGARYTVLASAPLSKTSGGDPVRTP